MKLKLLVLRCKDIEKSKEFYTSLGMVFIKEKHGFGPAHYAAKSGGFVLELYPAHNRDSDYSRLGFEISKLSTVINKLQIVEEYEYDSKQIKVVKDPDGRKIELYENMK